MLRAAFQEQNYRKCCSSRPVQAEVTLPVGSGLRDLTGDWLPTGSDFCNSDVDTVFWALHVRVLPLMLGRSMSLCSP